MIPDPPTSIANAPEVCHNTYSTVEMNEEQFNQWQPMIAGRWEHEDLYITARSRNEWFHSQLVSRNGGNFNFGAIEFRKNATVSIATALSVAVTNLKILQSWQEGLIRNGNAPIHGGSARKATRNSAIQYEITKHMRPDSK